MNECMENEIMQQDLEMLVDSDLPITALEGKSVLVTGATGLIGSQMVQPRCMFTSADTKSWKATAPAP